MTSTDTVLIICICIGLVILLANAELCVRFIKKIKKSIFRSQRKWIIITLSVGDIFSAILIIILGAVPPDTLNCLIQKIMIIYINFYFPFVFGTGLITLCVELVFRKRLRKLVSVSLLASFLSAAFPWLLGLVVVLPLTLAGFDSELCCYEPGLSIHRFRTIYNTTIIFPFGAAALISLYVFTLKLSDTSEYFLMDPRALETLNTDTKVSDSIVPISVLNERSDIDQIKDKMLETFLSRSVQKSQNHQNTFKPSASAKSADSQSSNISNPSSDKSFQTKKYRMSITRKSIVLQGKTNSKSFVLQQTDLNSKENSSFKNQPGKSSCIDIPHYSETTELTSKKGGSYQRNDGGSIAAKSVNTRTTFNSFRSNKSANINAEVGRRAREEQLVLLIVSLMSLLLSLPHAAVVLARRYIQDLDRLTALPPMYWWQVRLALLYLRGAAAPLAWIIYDRQLQATPTMGLLLYTLVTRPAEEPPTKSDTTEPQPTSKLGRGWAAFSRAAHSTAVELRAHIKR